MNFTKLSRNDWSGES